MDDTWASGQGVHVGSATNQINWATEAPTLTIGEWTWSQEIKEEEWVEKTLGQWKIPILFDCTNQRNYKIWICRNKTNLRGVLGKFMVINLKEIKKMWFRNIKKYQEYEKSE